MSYALANGFIYYMDERDKEWLDKNNEEARGEGTSAQGAVSNSGTRSSRNTKKGKDPEANHAIAISEDEFELVMAIFEKITHEKTEFLHHVSSILSCYSVVYLICAVCRVLNPGLPSLPFPTIMKPSLPRLRQTYSPRSPSPRGSRNHHSS